MVLPIQGSGSCHTLMPEELAAAMREGFEGRRRIFAGVRSPELPLAPAPNLAAHLIPVSGLLGHPTPPGTGFAGKLVRPIRQLLRKLLAPWFELQTRFNHTLIEQLTAQLTAQQQHLDQITARLNAVQRELPEAYHAVERRVNECFHDISALRTAPNADAPTFAMALEPFVQVHLPDPPAMLFAIGSVDLGSLLELGYDVIHGQTREHKSLPFRDGLLDGILAFAEFAGTDVAEWVRVLASNGVVIGSIPANSSANLAKLVAPLIVQKTVTSPNAVFWVAKKA